VRTLLQRPVAQVLVIAADALLLACFYLAFMTLRAGDSMHFDVSPLSIAFAFVAGLAISAGVWVMLRLGEARIGARFALGAGLLVFAVLAMFSIGLLVLPVALIVLGFAVRELRSRHSGRAVRASVAGAAAGIAAIAYLLVLSQPAAAECRVNGGGTSSGGLFGTIAVSSGGYSTNDGDSGGYIDEGDHITYFSCREGKLIDFHRESLPQGRWNVTTQPAPTVGRMVTVVFRIRPTADVAIPSDGFDFSITCRTCAEPRPVVRGHADHTGARAPYPANQAITFSAQVTFPTAGTWVTTPYDAPIEVR
jgi:hypothetical protein